MKKTSLIILSLLILFAGGVASESDFCKGFGSGYITGYKQASGSSFDPFVPFCPFQPFKGPNDPKSDYEHGYIIGYEKGKKDGR